MYQEQQFELPALSGLSAKQIEVHLKLYAGYVKNVNAIIETVKELKKDSEKNALALSELTRRLPFEWNGMRLHELYFEALGGSGMQNGPVTAALSKTFGSIDLWLAEFKAVGLMRGVGWVILSFDKKTSYLQNNWVSDHELGHLAGTEILIAMDIWEHAYLIDYLPIQKKDYIEAFFANLNWDIINTRFAQKK